MSSWTTAADLRAVLQRRWDSGRLLKAYAAGEPWQPLALPVRGPRTDELLDRLAEVRSWEQRLRRDCSGALRLETETVSSRRVGVNELPARVWVDGYPQLFTLLGVTGSVRRLDELLDQTRMELPKLVGWAVAHPRVVSEHEAVWSRLLATVSWIAAHQSPELYLRQVDVAGVDTKFIEAHRLLLCDLLEAVLPASRVDLRYSRSDFAGRFGLRRKPDYTRLRFLIPQTHFPGVSELTLRTAELARLDLGVGRVLMVENEISYLALPDLPDTVAIFGSGFALGSAAALTWLSQVSIIYWGDLDTYGFAILDRLRIRYPDVTSMLMDVDTLLAHPLQWVREEVPTASPLLHLSEEEGALYRDLVEDRYGEHVRLEQERIRFSRVRQALAELG
ncbi:Wadjet anti-phage system protein JetD domain-containing protein [uncultured Friedmanniella sp.]|uniref:Wadjet anti-phage system protein JetD domain-containing protein n=1 Tax=uncultured Friedmanniella sp. TaxID=335381 RepID=UPI0035CC04B9